MLYLYLLNPSMDKAFVFYLVARTPIVIYEGENLELRGAWKGVSVER